ncbi:transcriptional regulator [Paenibacillus sp. FSL P4-0081]|uniref:response regulator transcription factor n=1 Tax=unclassified Paenibacillus TaxID=185978 RepID=UPI0004F80EAD|nr:response regulator transcription factor [Paenibacillus sp. FSL P4-0081]AIQ31550.1 transcriptional regulator [Paenibacillus sp. FSL P4-0081]
MTNILVVEDDLEFNRLVCTHLNDNGFMATGCKNPQLAYDLMYTMSFDLIISDIMMPGIDGFEFAKTIRGTDQDIPILFMTSRDDMSSKQKGFRLGIDDYMVKPIELDEMILRINALMRRSSIANEKKIVVGSLTLNLEERAAYLNSHEVSLTYREFSILFKLLSYPKKTFTRAQLMSEFWGIDTETGPRVVDVHITKLREKLSECNDFEIVTVRGLGYKAVIK